MLLRAGTQPRPVAIGYILGWFAGWFGKQWQASSISRVPSYIRSLPAQAMIVVGVLGLVIAVAEAGSPTQSHVIIWTLCYGFLLAWGSPDGSEVAGKHAPDAICAGLRAASEDGDLSGGTVEGSCYFLDGGAHAGEGQERCARWKLVTCAIW